MPPKSDSKNNNSKSKHLQPSKSPKPLLPHGSKPLNTTNTALKPPKAWPSNLAYLTTPIYSPHLPPSTLRTLNPSNSKHQQPPHPSLAIKPITEPSHPAYGQSGLFALKPIKKGVHLLDYLGYVSIPPETSQTSDYVLSLDRDLGVAVDAEKMGNEGRFVNDFRGVRERANAEFYEVFREGEKRVGIRTLVEVGRGEEVCVSYGKGFWGCRKGDNENME